MPKCTHSKSPSSIALCVQEFLSIKLLHQCYCTETASCLGETVSCLALVFHTSNEPWSHRGAPKQKGSRKWSHRRQRALGEDRPKLYVALHSHPSLETVRMAEKGSDGNGKQEQLPPDARAVKDLLKSMVIQGFSVRMTAWCPMLVAAPKALLAIAGRSEMMYLHF